ncbi:MAG: iron-sulfur cluster repair di-iron protein [Candidatus Bipolaricaulia bacterium]
MTQHPQAWVSPSEQAVGSFVARDYRAAAVFERHNIDFCCSGDRSLQAACDNAGVDVDTVLSELNELKQTPSAPSAAGEGGRYDRWDLDFLADYIVNEHHAYAREALPEIESLAAKVAEAHGEAHPETREIADLWPTLHQEMSDHTQKEELLLFPYVKRLVQAEREGTTVAPPKFGSAQALVDEMEAEHDGTGDHLARIQELSNDFTPPDDACESFRALYEHLRAFDADTKKHIHLENNLLFPKSLQLERQLLKGSAEAS